MKTTKKTKQPGADVVLVYHGNGLIYANYYACGVYKGACRVTAADALILQKQGAQIGGLSK